MTEGSSSNVFIVKNKTVYTAPLTKYILPGITRIAILRLLATLDLPLEEKNFTLEELKQADEVFISSTTTELLPIIAVDGDKIGTGLPGEVTATLYAHYQELYW